MNETSIEQARETMTDSPKQIAERIGRYYGTSIASVVEFSDLVAAIESALTAERIKALEDAAKVADTTVREYVSKSLAPDETLIHSRNDYWQRGKGAELTFERIRALISSTPAKCVKCGHNDGVYPDGTCRFSKAITRTSGHRCICHCTFANDQCPLSTPASAAPIEEK